jgi:16S rRNA (guanine527-N7)-methyltransferase
VHAQRIEDFAERFAGPLDAVTARAVAPLKLLLEQCFRSWEKRRNWLVPEGPNAELELTRPGRHDLEA